MYPELLFKSKFIILKMVNKLNYFINDYFTWSFARFIQMSSTN